MVESSIQISELFRENLTLNYHTLYLIKIYTI